MRNRFSLSARGLTRALVLSLGLLASGAYAQEGPPLKPGGGIGNKTLQDNQDVINAQGVNAVISFMEGGSQKCDDDGTNCRSLFGNDDSFDHVTAQQMAQKSSGSNAFGFRDGLDGVNNVASQVGEVAVVCGSGEQEHVVAGVALKVLGCSVNTEGDAQLRFQVCTAPMRGLATKTPDNAVPCSTSPTAPDFRPPAGKVCLRAACDNQPVGSLDGWSPVKTVVWDSGLSPSASEDEKSRNGLGLIAYPDPGSGVLDFKANSESLTAVKVVQTFITEKTNQTALAVRVAYRHKMAVTKEMMIDGASSVSNPNNYTSHWDSLQKIGVNPLIPQYGEKVTQNATACLTKLGEGISKDNEVEICDPEYNSGVQELKPIGLTAKIAGPDEDCGTTVQCLKRVINTNSWVHTCQADVPLAIRTCEEVTNYDMVGIHSRRTRPTDVCYEKRTTTSHTCLVTATPVNCSQSSVFDQGGMNFSAPTGGSELKLIAENSAQYWRRYQFGTVGDNYWGTGYYISGFTIDVQDVENIKEFYIYDGMFDDHIFVYVNGALVFKWGYRPVSSGESYEPASYYPAYGQWGWLDTYCVREELDEATDKVKCVESKKVFNQFYDLKYSRSLAVAGYGYVDLRPYLRNGTNNFTVHTIVGGLGEMDFKFHASGWVNKCELSIQNDCAAFEADSY